MGYAEAPGGLGNHTNSSMVERSKYFERREFEARNPQNPYIFCLAKFTTFYNRKERIAIRDPS